MMKWRFNVEKEKIESLVDYLLQNSKLSTLNEKITQWFEQNPQEPIVVGLSDEHVKSLAEYIYGKSIGQQHCKGLYDMVIGTWIKTQAFVQHRKFQPNWKDAPEWANWLAMGWRGNWTWFEDKPLLMDSGFWSGDVSTDANFKYEFLATTLQQRPTPPAPKVEVGQVWRTNDEFKNKFEIIAVGQIEVVIQSKFNLLFEVKELKDFLAKFERVGGE